MKTCKKCCISKPFDSFSKHKGTRDGYMPKCKECNNAESRERYKAKQDGTYKPKKQGFRSLPEEMRKCPICNEVKSMNLFYKDSSRSSGVSSRCKECQNEYLKERRKTPDRKDLHTRRKWSQLNRNRLRGQDRAFKESNRDKLRVKQSNRRALKNSLPNTLTTEGAVAIVGRFDGKCAFCDDPSESLDHFIPLASGQVGTVKENIIPLCNRMNSSKRDRNPFEWSSTYLTNEQLTKFNVTVKYLSEINGLTETDYRQFVFSCFNKK